MDKAAAGKHVELPERKIKQVKEGVRRIVVSLPYLLCRALMIACVYHAVLCINLQRTTSQIKNGLPSPYNQLTGQRAEAKIHMIAPFGAYVEATVRETDNTTQPRTDSAIYCSSALQATEANHVFLIRTNEMALRGKCEKKAMSQAMIDILDKKAYKDWGEQTKDVYFGEYEHSPEAQNEGEGDTEVVNEEPHPVADMRVTRSMTSRAGGLEDYELDQATGKQSLGQTNEDAEEAKGEEYNEPVMRTPERRESDRGEFRESGFWDRHAPRNMLTTFEKATLLQPALTWDKALVGKQPKDTRPSMCKACRTG